jgi:hypothetical protein
MVYLPFLDILRACSGSEGEQEALIRKTITERVLKLDEISKEFFSAPGLSFLKVEDEGYLKFEPKQRRKECLRPSETFS